MRIGDEVILEFIEFFLIVLILVFIFVDFGFYIEELVAGFSSALSAMTL